MKKFLNHWHFALVALFVALVAPNSYAKTIPSNFVDIENSLSLEAPASKKDKNKDISQGLSDEKIDSLLAVYYSRNVVLTWYLGGSIGSPFGISRMTSFPTGSSLPNFGPEISFFAGFHTNKVVSVQFSFNGGFANMTPSESLLASGYSVDDREVADLYSWVLLHQYSAQVNINLLHVAKSMQDFPLCFEIYPKVAVVGTQSYMCSTSENILVQKGSSPFYIGIGGGAQLGYQINGKVKIGLYADILYMNGEPFDGVTQYAYSNNYVINSGIQLAFTLNRKKPKRSIVEQVVEEYLQEQAAIAVPEPEPEPEVVAEPEVVEKIVYVEKAPVIKGWKRITSEDMTIYFEKGSYTIVHSEMEKIYGIMKFLHENPEARVVIEGWADGSNSYVNSRGISLLRAETIKMQIMEDWDEVLDTERITIMGMGADRTSKDSSRARRAQVIILLPEYE